MRIVLDTNVLVSALINPHGPPATVVSSLMSARLTLVFDERILSEYRTVLARPRFAFDAEAVRIVLDALETGGEAICPAPSSVQLPDPDDLPFVEVADAGLVAALITGNERDFEPVSGTVRTRIYTPAAFVRKIARSGD